MKFTAGLYVLGLAATPAAAQWDDEAQTQQWSNFHHDNAGAGFVGDYALEVEYNFQRAWWVSELAAALDKWDVAIDMPGGIGTVTENPSINTRKCGAVTGKLIVCSDSYGFKQGGWLGVATASSDALGHFTKLTVQFNDTFYDSASYADPNERVYVACHELGHAFGLDHLDVTFDNPNKGSCMDYTSDVDGDGQFEIGPNPTNLIPTSKDYTVLRTDAMYGAGHATYHSSQPEEPTKPGRGGGGRPNKDLQFRTVGQPHPQAVLNAYADWGAIIGYDPQGRPNEFLMEHGNGHRTRTFVMWSREARPVGMR
ncbi:zinc metalloprotease [Sphingomicrobium arenosum]|uniref:hypothetical protein n=1 Tax=Sphingomicrobium arenosum TaxID=2233861 RepID=UPI00223E968D|nr:hypothetical protein [Sphingomicrobium arenosum]